MHSVTDASLRRLSTQAAASARRRANLNLHRELTDPVQRLFNALEPGTYVRPHRHVDPLRWEVFVALAGRAAVLTFDPDGRVAERVELSAAGSARAVEIGAGEWHTVVALEPGTVLFELKPGPYVPMDDKDFALWAPSEGEPDAAQLERWFRSARAGSPLPARVRP